MHVALNESNCFNSIHVHDDEDANVKVSKGNPTPNNKAPEKIEDKRDSLKNDVPRDWRILYNI